LERWLPPERAVRSMARRCNGPAGGTSLPKPSHRIDIDDGRLIQNSSTRNCVRFPPVFRRCRANFPRGAGNCVGSAALAAVLCAAIGGHRVCSRGCGRYVGKNAAAEIHVQWDQASRRRSFAIVSRSRLSVRGLLRSMHREKRRRRFQRLRKQHWDWSLRESRRRGFTAWNLTERTDNPQTNVNLLVG